LERVAARLQLPPQLTEVVDLAVEDGRDRPVLVGDGRIAGDQVDDREPVLADHAVRRGEATAGVRAAVLERFELRLCNLPDVPAFGDDEPTDTAHQARAGFGALPVIGRGQCRPGADVPMSFERMSTYGYCVEPHLLPDDVAPVRVAVIGAGHMGSHHLRIYSGLKGVELVGVVDADPSRAREAAVRHGCRAFSSIEEVAGEVDAATVAIPSSLHLEAAGALLERGVHCLVEKPLATSEEDCQALIDAAGSRGLVLLVGHVERFNPVVIQLDEILRDSVVHAIDVRRMSALSSRVTDVEVTTDLMVHDVDVVLSLMEGQVTNIFAQGVRTGGRAGQDYVTANLSFDNGSMASLTASRITQNKIRELHVTADLGFISASYSTQEMLIYRQGEASTLQPDGSEANYLLELEIGRVLVRADEPLVLEIRHFVDAVRNGTPPLVSGKDALRAMRVVWEIQELLSAPTAVMNG
jgi:virulence factor